MTSTDKTEVAGQAELAAYLASARGLDDISAVVESILASEDASFSDLVLGLSELLGSKEASSTLIAHLMTEGFDAEGLDLPGVRVLRAKYRARARKSFDRMSEGANDWRFFHREVFRDVIDEGWVIQSTVEKVNGETLFISTSLSSFVRLTTRMLQSLRYVPSEELDEDDRGALLEVLQELGFVEGSEGLGFDEA